MKDTTAHRPKKSCGQNFLTVPWYAQRIADAVPASGGGSVVEIGPGTGALTVHLLARFPHLQCVEFDRDVVPHLLERVGAVPLTVHQGDFLAFDTDLLAAPVHYAGNLPYNIAAMIIRKCLCATPATASITFMVQKEVALRICAAPDTAAFGFLSVMCQLFGNPSLLFHVPPGAFYPKPNVDSSVFQIVVDPHLSARIPIDERESFFAFVTRGFSMRRKMVAKTLTQTDPAGRPRSAAEEALERIGVPVTVRAEDLSTDNWISLYTDIGRQAA